MFYIRSKGGWERTTAFLEHLRELKLTVILNNYGKKGVSALANATPKDTGETAGAWSYKVDVGNGNASVTWTNSKMIEGTPLVIMLQYGHGTGTGGYVQGRDFINPAIRPILDEIVEKVWKEVTEI